MQLVEPETILETDRLLLEPILETHAEPLFAVLQDSRIYRYTPQEPPALEALRVRYQKLSSRLSPAGDQAWLNWAVRFKAGGRYIGRVEATVTAESSAEIAYELGPPFWGQGYAVEACRPVLALLFEGYGVSEVNAQVDTRNVPSIALLERLGFERTAFQPEADFFKGSSSDEYTYRVLQAGAAG